MRSFTFITYDEKEEPDEVLCTILSGNMEESEVEVHEMEARTQIGFRPNLPDDEEEYEDDDDEDV